jgi:cytosine/adenosine deaminase-related metal-dependent hydrolase
MSKANNNPKPTEVSPCANDDTSRRGFLKASAIIGGAAATQALPTSALAQGAGATDTDAELARLQGQRRILLRGGIVLTLDRQVGDFANADVLIEDGKIREIRPNLDVSDAAVVDASNRIVIPGFIDTHSHSYQGLLRSSLPSGVVDPDYNRDIQNNITLHYQPADVHLGVLVTALGLMDMGTTTIVDISQSNHTPEHSDALIASLKEAGIRAVCAYSRGAGPGSKYPQDVVRLRQTYFNSQDQLLTLAMATSLDPKIFEYTREVGLRSVLHVRINSEPLLALGRAKLLRPGDEYIHCTHLSDAAWRLIKDTGGRVSHSPPLEMAMAHGMPSIQDALDHGMASSLSSDHSATVAQDMFGIMRTAFNLQRLFILQRKRNGEQNTPPLLTPRQVLEFATIEGARCADLESKTGSLTPGKDADIVMLRTDRFDVWPVNNAASTVVNLMNPSHIENIFIAGKVKKWRGSLVGHDVARIQRLAREARDAVLARANFKVDLLA